MKNKTTLLDKVNCLLRRIGAPKYLNKYGPKKYTLGEKVYALFMKADCKSSFRRTAEKCSISKSTLHYAFKKLPWNFIKNMLAATAAREAKLAAIDGTTFERKSCGFHYLNRAGIDIKQRKNSKLSILINTRNKKILSARFRKNISHDIKDAKYLINNSVVKPEKIVADKGYDAEWFHKFLAKQEIKCCIPLRKNAVNGFYRKRSKVDGRTSRRRPMVENAFFKLKQLYGRSLNCITARNMRAEVFFRLTAYNFECLFKMI